MKHSIARSSARTATSPSEQKRRATGSGTGTRPRYEDWSNATAHPGLVRNVYLVHADGGRLGVRQWDAAARTFVDISWPAMLQPWQQDFEGELVDFNSGQQRQPLEPFPRSGHPIDDSADAATSGIHPGARASGLVANRHPAADRDRRLRVHGHRARPALHTAARSSPSWRSDTSITRTSILTASRWSMRTSRDRWSTAAMTTRRSTGCGRCHPTAVPTLPQFPWPGPRQPGADRPASNTGATGRSHTERGDSRAAGACSCSIRADRSRPPWRAPAGATWHSASACCCCSPVSIGLLTVTLAPRAATGPPADGVRRRRLARAAHAGRRHQVGRREPVAGRRRQRRARQAIRTDDRGRGAPSRRDGRARAAVRRHRVGARLRRPHAAGAGRRSSSPPIDSVLPLLGPDNGRPSSARFPKACRR